MLSFLIELICTIRAHLFESNYNMSNTAARVADRYQPLCNLLYVKLKEPTVVGQKLPPNLGQNKFQLQLYSDLRLPVYHMPVALQTAVQH